ncbi:non-ribosomal peptide synthetase [Rhodococcus sp. JVH1]|uniref:non-ribosomal peptide synthetase n=1 Tax=Rhodococcus sp. JVH1 TaxID=745408 RepID=UPI00027225FC|nr:non-ribosomal peptide synthetase [Rhodococcus sp. JVH1]EJJ01830.1 actinomycin synthetase II [Rhodococcus sp. JVH1]
MRTAFGHAMTVRVPRGVSSDMLAVRWGTASRRWWERATRPSRLWVVDVPAGSASEEARRRLAAECRRPVAVDGPAVRAVVMQYLDQVADLVVVADRRDLDTASLTLVCDVLVGVRDADTVTANPVGRHRHGRALGGWSAEVLRSSHPLVAAREDMTATVAAAAAVVTGRRDDLSVVTVPVWRVDRTRPPRMLGGFENWVDLAFHTSLDRTLVELAEEVKCSRQQEVSWESVKIGEMRSTATGVLGTVTRDTGREYLPCQTAPFPLTLVPVADTGGHATLEVYADPVSVDADTAARFGQWVARVVNGLRDPSPRRRRVFGAAVAPVGAGVRAPVSSGRIEDLVVRHAHERPDAVAVTHGRRTLTYRALEEQSAWMARGLHDRGVGPGDRVGICVDRSVDLVVTMLAVLRSGAAFVPMDVRHPPDRLAYTARDAGVRLVVTELQGEALWAGVPAVTPAELPGSVSGPGEVDWAVGGDGAPAYVVYTSGSTGRPKGVVIPHRAVPALMSATATEFAPTPGDTWSMFHSPAFDFSVWEIWGSLSTGGRLVIVPYWISRSPVEFHTLLADERVSVLSQTPSAFVLLAAADRDLEPLSALRLVVFGGETLDPRVVLPWLDRYPESRCRLVNMFGTTETTVHVTAHTVTRRDALTGSRTVGKPLPGWEMAVADEFGDPLPNGLTGEIYVGGAGVALGYLDRAGLTACRFVAAPGGSRWYRTGDRGRICDDGTLEHLGRLDTQVQIRGFRVELDEVRSVLLDDPVVTAAAVVPSGRPEDPAGIALDAYVVPGGSAAAGETETIAAIRERAARFLPEHMVPRSITLVDALPLTINGKIDVARLPAPAPRSLPHNVVEPQDGGPLTDAGTAHMLTDIWESVLGVPVSLDDNLFELGGNSLCAIKADSMMRRLGLPALPMRELYRHPSIRGICGTLARLYPPRPDR